MFEWKFQTNPEPSSEENSLSGGPNGGVSMIDHSFVTNDTGFGDEITGTTIANNILSPSRLLPLVPDSPIRNNQPHSSGTL
ncbi:unnamed protein product [Onchocerca flexuosa]|uniref:U6 snRNA phosphodiesterase n=1 Tax=Onchocerca flexuosa TaxID=387005 RepID=A0A183HGZ8_9BILA|nr:unnamed protein product [Onchocerca flexuosa]